MGPDPGLLCRPRQLELIQATCLVGVSSRRSLAGTPECFFSFPLLSPLISVNLLLSDCLSDAFPGNQPHPQYLRFQQVLAWPSGLENRAAGDAMLVSASLCLGSSALSLLSPWIWLSAMLIQLQVGFSCNSFSNLAYIWKRGKNINNYARKMGTNQYHPGIHGHLSDKLLVRKEGRKCSKCWVRHGEC